VLIARPCSWVSAMPSSCPSTELWQVLAEPLDRRSRLRRARRGTAGGRGGRRPTGRPASHRRSRTRPRRSAGRSRPPCSASSSRPGRSRREQTAASSAATSRCGRSARRRFLAALLLSSSRRSRSPTRRRA
jgi:hypothetical protein